MIIALIPARIGSKRIPEKNLEKIGDKTLIEWAVIATKMAPIDHVYVTTDSLRIANHADGLDCTVLQREPKAATDDATDYDVVKDFLDKVHAPSRIKFIVYLRPTTPLRPFEAVGEAVQRMIDTPAATGLRSVHEMSESAYKCFEVHPGGILYPLMSHTIDMGVKNVVDSLNNPNHFYPATYQANGVVDIIRPEIINRGQTYGDSVIAHVTQPVIEIDTPFDLRMAKMQYAYDRHSDFEVWR